MKRNFVLILSLFLCCNFKLIAQSETIFSKSTHLFAERGNETLYLDRYWNPDNTIEKNPCIIFVFGGAFARGARDVPKYIPYFDYLIDHGYTIVSMDYRLGLKEAAERKDLNEEQFAKLFINAVNIAVEDLYDATNYVLQNANEWNINTDYIIANGSSAGAVTVLQGEYGISNNLHNVSSKLPAGFNYAGIIAFAGAIYLPQGDIVWQKPPCPMMMLHGDADLQVPYDRLVYEGMGLYGAKSISATLAANNYPYYFYRFDDYGHEIASDPMQQNKEDILWFLNTFVKDKKSYQITKEQKEIGKPEVNKDFNFQDYVRGNFDR